MARQSMHSRLGNYKGCHMQRKASTIFKVAYSLTLGGAVFLSPMFSPTHGWVGSILAGDLWQPQSLFFLGLTVFWAYRVMTILRDPAALDVYLSGKISQFLYFWALLCIWFGLISMLFSLFFLLPVVYTWFFSTMDHFLLSLFLAQWIYFLVLLGVFGVVLFEIVARTGKGAVVS